IRILPIAKDTFSKITIDWKSQLIGTRILTFKAMFNTQPGGLKM
ncbi:22558_t:CDS:1, partial [Cetraspora pellucida]